MLFILSLALALADPPFPCLCSMPSECQVCNVNSLQLPVMLLSTESCLLRTWGQSSGKAIRWHFKKYVKIHHRCDPFVALTLTHASRASRAVRETSRCRSHGAARLSRQPPSWVDTGPYLRTPLLWPGWSLNWQFLFHGSGRLLRALGPRHWGHGSGRREAARRHWRFVWLLLRPPARVGGASAVGVTDREAGP